MSELPDDLEWARYTFRNEEAHERYLQERDTIDARWRFRRRPPGMWFNRVIDDDRRLVQRS